MVEVLDGLLLYFTEKKRRYLIFILMVFITLVQLKHLIVTVGVYFKKALFVPNASVYNKVGSHALPPTETQIDLSWQFALQRVWENLMLGDKGINYMCGTHRCDNLIASA